MLRAGDAAPNRILIVDDDPLFSLRLGRLLRSAGYEVITAATAGEAVTVLNRHPSSIGLAVIDLVLPDDVSGVDIILALSRSKGRTKILAVSGRLSATQLETLKYAGADAVLQKPAWTDPIDETEWLHCIQGLLASYRQG